MLDVHPPHESVHTWKSFFIHIAIITIGLLIAVLPEKTVEYFHHRPGPRRGRKSIARGTREWRVPARERENKRVGGAPTSRRSQQSQAAAPRRLQPGDHLIFIRPYNRLADSAWKIVHESDAAAYIPIISRCVVRTTM
jgi:hypothetical protein